MKGGLALSAVELTDEGISVKGLLLRRTHISIQFEQMRQASLYEGRPGLIELTFHEAEWGLLARFAVSGKPPGERLRIILNVKNGLAWLDAIESRLPV